jgi:hypothetical protein
MRHPTIHYVFEKPDPQEPERNAARVRWLVANDVHTEFFDAGIGCCWLARIGDQEPVIGPTEDEAIARLARLNGLELIFEVWHQLTGEAAPRSVRPARAPNF